MYASVSKQILSIDIYITIFQMYVDYCYKNES